MPTSVTPVYVSAIIITGHSVLSVGLPISVIMSWAFVMNKFRRGFRLSSEQGLCGDRTRPGGISVKKMPSGGHARSREN